MNQIDASRVLELKESYEKEIKENIDLMFNHEISIDNTNDTEEKNNYREEINTIGIKVNAYNVFVGQLQALLRDED